MSARKRKSIAPARPLTIYDREKYFDATFSEEERKMLRRRIEDETGLIGKGHHGDRFLAICKCGKLLRDAKTEIMNALRMYPVPADWTHIHVCKQLEIEYKSFAKNVPKLPIEPFYKFVEPLFPHFKPAKNKMQLEIQTHNVHLAFIDWIDEACVKAGCLKSSHSWACWDRFEERSYEAAAERIWAHNARRQKFSPLRLVHSRDEPPAQGFKQRHSRRGGGHG